MHLIDEFMEILDSEEHRIREIAVRALSRGPFDKEEVVDKLLLSLSNTGRRIERGVVWTLGKLGNKKTGVVDALLKVLKTHSDTDVRREAAVALINLQVKRKDVHKAICKAISKSDPQNHPCWFGSIRDEVIDALHKLNIEVEDYERAI